MRLEDGEYQIAKEKKKLSFAENVPHLEYVEFIYASNQI